MSDYREQFQTKIPATSIIMIAALTIVADLGYYILFPLLGLKLGYNNEPIFIAVYYALWCAIVIGVFWPAHQSLISRSDESTSAILLFCLLSCIVIFALFILPMLPPIRWTEDWQAPELMSVTAWYFLPKSIEILFQQLLIAALVLSFDGRRFSLKTISISCALLFGVAHTLLAVGEMPMGYVIRFIVAASAFGALFPFLILRIKNGLAFSYSLHWLYYLITIVMAHTISPYAT